MRKIIEHIDQRNWRTLEYFRMLNKQSQLQLNRKKVTADIMVCFQNFEKTKSFALDRNLGFNLIIWI